jgi:hypothetical protein
MLVMIGQKSRRIILADDEGEMVALLELEGDYLVGYASHRVFLLALKPFFVEIKLYPDYVKGIPVPELKEAWVKRDYDSLAEKIARFIGKINPSLN